MFASTAPAGRSRKREAQILDLYFLCAYWRLLRLSLIHI